MTLVTYTGTVARFRFGFDSSQPIDIDASDHTPPNTKASPMPLGSEATQISYDTGSVIVLGSKE